MKFRLSIVLFLFALPNLSLSQPTKEIVIGSAHSMYSETLGEDLTYWVALPESYTSASHSHKRYPVLVVLDGRSLFKPLASTLSFMSTTRAGSRRVPEMILVGIQSTNRERDFTPDKVVTRRKNDTGGGDQFLYFLEQELLPMLRGTYRTVPFNILVGHSLGGLLASHAYLKPDTQFDAFIAIDPSFGTWDAATMDQKIETATGITFDRFLYIATANWGTRNIRNRDRHVRFYEALHQRNNAPQFRAQLDYFEHENHGSIPLIAFYNGLLAMFDGFGLTHRDVKSPEQLTSHYADISDRLSFDFSPPEGLVDRAGSTLLRSDDPNQKATALSLLELNSINYPGSFNAFMRLGEAYSAMNNKEKAIENYRQSLAIKPGDEKATNRLNVLLDP